MTNEVAGRGPDYDAWAERIEADDRPAARTGKALRGEAARAYAHQVLTAAAETPEEVEAVERAAAGGRPTLAADRPSGKSPLWQVRAPERLDAALRARAQAEGRTFSEVLRDAASEYLTRHAS
jgi:hypothetical protein